MKSKLLILILLLAVSMLWGAGQRQGLAQSVAAPETKPMGSVAPPAGYPEPQVYPGVAVSALRLKAPVSNARRFLTEAAEIIID
ncbi:MAG: hypothetical protein ACLQU2_31660 [Candidatus Binataceae bacterium]